MDTLNIIVTAVCTIIGALGGGSLLYFRQNKALKKIEVERSQADEWKKLYDEQCERTQESDNRCHELYLQRKKLYDEKIEAHIHIAKLEVQLAQKDVEIVGLKHCKCIVNHCTKRTPPREYETELSKQQ